MTKIINETPQAAYNRGYSKAASTAQRKLHDLRRAYGAAFERIRKVAEAEIGKCATCNFWTRHQSAPWGRCEMFKAANATHPEWPVPWANVECEKVTCPGSSKLTTHESFGCINHMTRKPSE